MAHSWNMLPGSEVMDKEIHGQERRAEGNSRRTTYRKSLEKRIEVVKPIVNCIAVQVLITSAN